MKYDFVTAPERRNTGSTKWKAMETSGIELPKDCVPMSVADMELKIAPEIVAGLQKYIAEVVPGYTSPTHRYWEAVLSWMQERHNYHFEPSQVVITPGVVTALFAAVQALTEPGDGVIVFTPVYGPFYRAIQENDRTIASCPMIVADGYYSIDFEKYETLAANPKNKLLLFCNPHNPTGRVWRREELERVEKIARKNDLYVVSDEIHQDIVFPGYEHTVYHNLSEEARDHAIVCTSASKTFNIAGLQCSNIIIPNDEMRHKFEAAIGKLALHGANSLGMEATRIGYAEGGAWLDAFLDHVLKNEQYVLDFLEKHDLPIEAHPLEGTYLLWVDMRGYGMTQEELIAFCAKTCHIFPTSGTFFGNEGEGFVRINLACPRKTLETTLAHFDTL